MGSVEDETPDVDSVVNQLRLRIDERRRAGVYPPELEQEMAAHFQRITSNRVRPNVDDVHEALVALKERFRFAMERIPMESRVPGGAALHKGLAKVQARQVIGIFEQVRDFAEATWDVLALLTAAVENANSHVHVDLVGQIDTTIERVASYERAPAGSAEAMVDLRHRLERLEAAQREQDFHPWFTNDRFEAAFRGNRAELLERYRSLAVRFAQASPVLDIGCGRGEFLELLQELGVEARGVELDPDLVKECNERGLTAEVGDGLAALRTARDGSFGGVVLNQVVEHLTAQAVVDLALLAYDKLRPGGMIMCETVNPQSLYVFAHSFYVDPTHVRPVHPAYLSFVFREAGFSTVEIDWRTPPPGDDILTQRNPDDPSAEHDNENINRLNQLLFAPQEYALIATR